MRSVVDRNVVMRRIPVFILSRWRVMCLSIKPRIFSSQRNTFRSLSFTADQKGRTFERDVSYVTREGLKIIVFSAYDPTSPRYYVQMNECRTHDMNATADRRFSIF